MFFDLFSDFFDNDLNLYTPMPVSTPPISCPSCQMPLSEFSKTGKLGCSECYNAFRPQMKQVLRSIHGNVIHNGKIPHNAEGKLKAKRELETLKLKLNDAIAAERFEDAAKLRDKIKQISQREGI